ncbi:unnamed protein product [Didymodactylos carnosus]|uniref:C2 domain-containing protein n=1 Tax=Didymodactylos carnosus TaxID=1234261 RepID=A0A814KP99_9BILA|nr:unnamed protein product [Didymodactylos carnosus]CAF1553701.1 unnamed protein product [Didymodactylos carnosus]CAF3823939.1 unnamed protein product [Didymodactylos carnosus]CAF4344304.1 unnamed protein product [Didymodactylos carnosus]
MPQLQVTIVEARGLKQQDTFSANDGFVEVYLDKNYKQKTKTKKNSNKPQWNETFVFNHQTGQDTLFLDVYDQDLLTKDTIGKTTIDLKKIYDKGKEKNNKQSYIQTRTNILGHLDAWIKLPHKTDHTSSNGELHVIIDYQTFDKQYAYL